MRIGIAGFMHESCTFNPLKANRTAFVDQSYCTGSAMLRDWRDAHHEIAGFFDTVEEGGEEAVPLLMAWATPSGPVTDDIFDEVTAKLSELISSVNLDGLLLAQHGAMVSDSFLDADGEILKRIRQGSPNLPIVISLDFHGNISPQVVELSTAAVAYQTCPHVDQRQCGKKAAGLLLRHLRDEISLTQYLCKPAVYINIMKHDTSLEPLVSHMAKARQAEESQGVVATSLLAGFAYADVPQMGPSIIVVTDNDLELAQETATALGENLKADQHRFQSHLPSASEAVAMALECKDHPVVLVDTGDNVGGGSAGDGTVILEELLAQSARRAVICLFAPDEVEICRAAGEGSTVDLTVGGKVDNRHGSPIQITATVRALHNGTYIEEEIRHGGKRVNHMGPTVLLEMEGENLVVLTTHRHPPFSLGQLTCLGIQPAEQNILVVKAAIAYKAAYAPIAARIIEVGTPGLTTVVPQHLNYRHAQVHS